MDPIIWAILFLTVGILLGLLELFFPSGTMAVVGLLSVVAGNVMAFQKGEWYGIGFLSFSILALPAMMAYFIRYWPSTRMGRAILPSLPTSDEVIPAPDQLRDLRSLVGRVGTSKTLMLPSGMVVIDRIAYPAMTDGVAVEAGQNVKVVDVRARSLVVRPTSEPPREISPDQAAEASFDSLDIDSLQDPQA